MASQICAILISVFAISIDFGKASQPKAQQFLASSTQDVVNYETVTSAETAMECVRKCVTYSHCVTSAFDVSLGLCYLHPQFSELPGNQEGSIIYKNTSPECDVLVAASVLPNAMFTWQRTLTSLEGDVTCDADFLLDREEASGIRCLSTGEWVTTGHCRQRIWKSDTGVKPTLYPLPRPLTPGQSMCFTFLPNWNAGFLLDLTTGNDILLHLRYHSDSQQIVVNSLVGGGWSNQAKSLSFPGHHLVQLQLNITAVSAHRLAVYTNGELLTFWDTALTVDKMTTVHFPDKAFGMMDLFCSH